MDNRASFNDLSSAGEFWADGFVIEPRENGTTRVTYLREHRAGFLDVVATFIMPTAHVEERWPDYAERDQKPDWYTDLLKAKPPSDHCH